MEVTTHTITEENETFEVPCYDTRVPEYYLTLKGKRNGKRRDFKIRTPCLHFAHQLKNNFYKRIDGGKSTGELMKEMDWTDIQLGSIVQV